MSINMKRYRSDPEYRAKKLAKNRALYKDGNYKAKRSESSRAWYLNNREKVLIKSLQRSPTRTQQMRERRAANPEWTKMKDKERYQKYVASTPKEERRLKHLKWKFGLTPDQYKNLLIQQDFKCGICLLPFTENREPCVDHCHQTERVRELLCRKCNTCLAQANDNIEILQSAIRYLRKHKDKDGSTDIMLPEAST